MQSDENLKLILINLQKKYNIANEILNLTKEMERTMYSNDEVAMIMIVGMRQDSMSAVDNIEALNRNIISGLPEDLKQKITKILAADESITEFESQNEKLIFEAVRRTKTMFKNIIAIDSVLNKKLNAMNNQN